MTIIKDWFDVLGIISLFYFIMAVGIWSAPQMPENVRLPFSVALICLGIYCFKQIVSYILSK